MLRSILSPFRKLRILIGALRNGLYGLVAVIGAWILVVPPSESEIANLALPANATAQNEDLRLHRMAKLLLVVGTDRTYEMIADQSGGTASADDIRLGTQIVASGVRIDAASTEVPAEADSGAKFVSARNN